jgi:hypothetical protein
MELLLAAIKMYDMERCFGAPAVICGYATGWTLALRRLRNTVFCRMNGFLNSKIEVEIVKFHLKLVERYFFK